MQYFFLFSELLSVCKRNEKEIEKKPQTTTNKIKPKQKLKGKFLFFLHF